MDAVKGGTPSSSAAPGSSTTADAEEVGPASPPPPPPPPPPPRPSRYAPSSASGSGTGSEAARHGISGVSGTQEEKPTTIPRLPPPPPPPRSRGPASKSKGGTTDLKPVADSDIEEDKPAAPTSPEDLLLSHSTPPASEGGSASLGSAGNNAMVTLPSGGLPGNQQEELLTGVGAQKKLLSNEAGEKEVQDLKAVNSAKIQDANIADIQGVSIAEKQDEQSVAESKEPTHDAKLAERVKQLESLVEALLVKTEADKAVLDSEYVACMAELDAREAVLEEREKKAKKEAENLTVLERQHQLSVREHAVRVIEGQNQYCRSTESQRLLPHEEASLPRRQREDKDDDTWNKRQIIAAVALVGILNLLAQIRKFIPPENVDLVMGIFTSVWALGSVAFPSGIFGKMRSDKNMSRYVTRVSYMFFTIFAMYALYLFSLPLPLTHVVPPPIAPAAAPSGIPTTTTWDKKVPLSLSVHFS